MDSISKELLDDLPVANDVIAEAVADALRPDEKLSVSEWADKNRILGTATSHAAGKWKTDRTPYLKEIMDCLSVESSITDVVFKKGSQLGGSEGGLNWIGYVIDHAPGPMMIVWPTSNTAKRNSKARIKTLIEESPVLRDKVKDSRSRDSGNTTLMKEFPGGLLIISGANSAAELKSQPVKYLFMDEVDEYPDDVDGQGPAIELAEKRTTNFPRKKRFKVSTPTVDGFSNIDEAYKDSDQRECFIPCPSCHEKQVLKWEQMRWEVRKRHEFHCMECGVVSEPCSIDVDVYECPDCEHKVQVDEKTFVSHETDELISVHYECEHCHTEVYEHHKTWMLANHEWIAQNPGPDRAAGFDLSSLYSPLGWYSWREAVKDWLKALKNEVKKKVFTNTVLAQTYKEDGEQPDTHVLKERAGGYRLGTVPGFALLLTAAVDVQGDRIEVKVKGWGPGEETALVDYQKIHVSFDKKEAREQLDDYLFHKTFKHASGVPLKIHTTFIDSGYKTHTVYKYCRDRKHKNVFAIKGMKETGKPILGKATSQDIKLSNGKTIKNGVKLWQIGVHNGKQYVYGYLKHQEQGEGYAHFPFGLPDEYFDQLTVEKLVPFYDRYGQCELRFKKKSHERNEALDLEVYNYAAALKAGLQIKNWKKLQEQLNLKQKDLFGSSEEEQEDIVSEETRSDEKESVVASTAKKKKRRGTSRPRRNFVKNW